MDDLSRGYRHNVDPTRLREFNLKETDELIRLCQAEHFDAVIHFAAFISVGESSREPELYFANNVSSTLSLLTAMKAAGIRRLVFSSTAAIYGFPERSPISENQVHAPVSPYGESKLMVEKQS